MSHDGRRRLVGQTPFYIRLSCWIIGVALCALNLPGCGTGMYDVPFSAASQLQPWNSTNYPLLSHAPTYSHWIILKCAFSDDPTSRALPPWNIPPAIKDLDTYINLFLAQGGVGTGNLLDYYRDVTYGTIMVQPRVYGWFNAPFASNNTLSRVTRIEQCMSAVPASAGIDFSQYDGVIVVTNKPQDGGAAGIGKIPLQVTVGGVTKTFNMGAVVFDPNSMWTAFAAHELGHGLGLPHSWDDAGNQYGDPYDIMSALNTLQFLWLNYPPEGAARAPQGSAGPGPNLPNLLFLQAIPPLRLATFNSTIRDQSPQTYTLTALSHGNNYHLLGVQITTANPSDVYTIEYRQADGWDTGLFPSGFVTIHEYKVGSSPYSYLQKQGGAGTLVAGKTFQDTGNRFQVLVQSIDRSQGTATVIVK